METSRLGILFIARREGLVLSAYQDGKHYSIGFGHNDPELDEGDKVTVKQAFNLLKSDIKRRERELYKMLHFGTVQQNQYDAMMSLLFNRGPRPVLKVAKLLLDGQVIEAGAEFLEWGVDGAGKSMKGILLRRKLEREVFLHAQYGDDLLDIPFWTGDPRRTKPKIYHVQDDDL